MNKLKQYKSVIIAVIICIILCTVTGTVLYHKGYNDNIPAASDGSPTVYITPTGKRYHLHITSIFCIPFSPFGCCYFQHLFSFIIPYFLGFV